MSPQHAITGAARIFDGETWIEGAALLLDGDRVAGIVPETALENSVRRTELDGGVLAPGFLDLQVNGGGGVMFNDSPSVDAIRTICEAHRPFGTTALLPTLITDTREITRAAIAAGIEATKANVPGFMGLHLEGPHLSIARKGAHDPALIRPMDDDDLEALLEARKHLPVLLTTVAPESVTPEQIGRLAQGGVYVSLGHSDTLKVSARPTHALLRFDLGGAREIGKPSKAVLRLFHTAQTSSSKASVGVFRCRQGHDEPDTKPILGLAAKYPGDQGIGRDPAVVFFTARAVVSCSRAHSATRAGAVPGMLPCLLSL